MLSAVKISVSINQHFSTVTWVLNFEAHVKSSRNGAAISIVRNVPTFARILLSKQCYGFSTVKKYKGKNDF